MIDAGSPESGVAAFVRSRQIGIEAATVTVEANGLVIGDDGRSWRLTKWTGERDDSMQWWACALCAVMAHEYRGRCTGGDRRAAGGCSHGRTATPLRVAPTCAGLSFSANLPTMPTGRRWSTPQARATEQPMPKARESPETSVYDLALVIHIDAHRRLDGIETADAARHQGRRPARGAGPVRASKLAGVEVGAIRYLETS